MFGPSKEEIRKLIENHLQKRHKTLVGFEEKILSMQTKIPKPFEWDSVQINLQSLQKRIDSLERQMYKMRDYVEKEKLEPKPCIDCGAATVVRRNKYEYAQSNRRHPTHIAWVECSSPNRDSHTKSCVYEHYNEEDAVRLAIGDYNER